MADVFLINRSQVGVSVLYCCGSVWRHPSLLHIYTHWHTYTRTQPHRWGTSGLSWDTSISLVFTLSDSELGGCFDFWWDHSLLPLLMKWFLVSASSHLVFPLAFCCSECIKLLHFNFPKKNYCILILVFFSWLLLVNSDFQQINCYCWYKEMVAVLGLLI